MIEVDEGNVEGCEVHMRIGRDDNDNRRMCVCACV